MGTDYSAAVECLLSIVRATLPHICSTAALRYLKHSVWPSVDLIKRLLATTLTTQDPESLTLMQTCVGAVRG